MKGVAEIEVCLLLVEMDWFDETAYGTVYMNWDSASGLTEPLLGSAFL